MFAKARYLNKIGSWKEAITAYDEIMAKEKVGTSKKIDATMEKAKIALFNMVLIYLHIIIYEVLKLSIRQDTTQLKSFVAEAKKLNDSGGDWDRRNRLKVFDIS